MTRPSSPCCNAPVLIAGKGMTHWYACGKCAKPIVDRKLDLAFVSQEAAKDRRCFEASKEMVELPREYALKMCHTIETLVKALWDTKKHCQCAVTPHDLDVEPWPLMAEVYHRNGITDSEADDE